MSDINSNRTPQCVVCCDANIQPDKLQALDCEHMLCQECAGEITTKNNEKLVLCPECNHINFLPSIKSPNSLLVEQPDFRPIPKSPLASPRLLRNPLSPRSPTLGRFNNPMQQVLYTHVKELRKDLKNTARQENSNTHKMEKHYVHVKAQIEAEFEDIIETLMTRKTDVVASLNVALNKERSKRVKERAKIKQHLRFWSKFEAELKTSRQYSDPEVEAMKLKCMTLQQELQVTADQTKGQTKAMTFDSSRGEEIQLMASNFGRLMNIVQETSEREEY